jgi:predicted HicB family RNase H-like nuclease
MSTSSLIEYQNFKAELRFDQDDEWIVVKVIGLPVIFHARSKKAAEEEFRRLVDQGLLNKITPAEKALFDKEYSGNIALRLSSFLHQDLTLSAHRVGKSLNRYIEDRLQIAVDLEALGEELELSSPKEKALPESIHYLLEDSDASAKLFQQIQGCLRDRINIFQFPAALKSFLTGFGESLDEIEAYIQPDKLEEFTSAIARLIQEFDEQSAAKKTS